MGGLKRECGVRGDSQRVGGDGQREVEGGGIQYNPGDWNTEENKKTLFELAGFQGIGVD